MRHPAIEPLLILQDRDARRASLESQLKIVPAEIALVEQKVASEKAAIEAARSELRELETRKKLLETEIGSAEQQLAKYRTQQLSVRKNDEYQALGHEIETVQGRIGELEGGELEAMYGIDTAKKKFAGAEAVLKANIAGHEARIATLRERGVNLTAELATARAELAAARSGVEAGVLRIYDRASGRGLPAVVPVRDSKCGGCHLKISSDVESAVRGKAGPELPLCDQCGRIVYWEG